MLATGPSKISELIITIEDRDNAEKNELRRALREKDTEILCLKRKLKKKQMIINRNHKGSGVKKSARKIGGKGNRWTNKQVQDALQLKFSCGRTGYETLLEQNYPLPSISTLYRRSSHIRFEPGVLTEVFDLLKHKAESMNTFEKLCTITLDEMKIKEGYGYCPKTGHCYGKVNLPNHEGDATHALVFMMGGISTHWKQAVGYWFTPGMVTNAVSHAI